MRINRKKMGLALTWVMLAALLLSVFGAVPVWAQTNYYVSTTGNDNNDGTAPDDAHAWLTIQHAIDNVIAGDTINVADGTYTITAAITVDKGVTITGNTSNPQNVVVKYDPASTSLNGFEIGAADITIQGFKIMDCFRGVHFGRSDVTSTGCTITNCVFDNIHENAIGEVAAENTTISNNTITNCTQQAIEIRANEATSLANRTEVTGNTISSCAQACIQTYLGKYVYIYDNTINATEDKGINVIRPNATGTADRIQVIGNTISETKWQGIQVIGAPHTYVYNNTLTKCNYWGGDGTGDWDYASIHVQDDTGPTYSHYTVIDRNTISDGINGIQTWSNDVTITNNEIYDMGSTYAATKTVGTRLFKNSAILVGSNWGSGDIDPTGVTIQGNSIHDNYWGLFYSADLTSGVNASANWWGTNTPTGVAGEVSGNVDYTPWLASGADTSGDPGFQGDFSTLWVDDDSPQTGTTGRIQEGVDLVSGSTVNVANGTYTATSLASIVITKANLSLIGESRDGTIIEGGTWGTSSAGWPKGIHVYTNSVTIKNFTVQGFTGDGTSTGGYGVLFRDYAHDMPGEGYIYYSGGTVENVKSQDNYSPMYALVHQNLTIHNCLIQNNLSDGMFIARESDNATITNNTVLNSGDHGIWVGKCWMGLGPSDNATITGNTVNGAREGGISFVASVTATISNNTITNVAGEGYSKGALSLRDGPSNVEAYNNHIYGNDGSWGGYSGTGHGVGIDGTPSNINLHDNNIYGNTGYGCYNYSTVTVTAENNWWGAASGPGPVGPGGGDNVSTYVDYSPWWGDATGTFTVTENAAGEIVVLSGTSAADIQAIIDDAPFGATIVLPPEVITVSGGFTISNPGITIKLSDGTIIQASSPCFVVTADDTTITSVFLGGKCIPTGGDHGIVVSSTVTNTVVNNLVISGIEIDGSTPPTGDGIHITSTTVISNLQIFDNYIHNMGGDGIEYASGVTVGGVHEVQGNLFQGNTGVGINNVDGPSYNVEYNSWDHYDGPVSGDGVTGINVADYTPWTHVALSMASSGSPVANEVAEGYQITYTVKMDAQEVYGADFDLKFDKTKLSVVSIVTNTNFTQVGSCTVSTPTAANASGEISFCGQRTSALNGAAQNVFTVTFQGLNAGVVNLDLDEMDDAFAMHPPSGGSNNIYASALTDGSVTVSDATAVTGRIDLQGRADDTGAVMTFTTGSDVGYGPFVFSTSGYWGDISASNVVHTDTYSITVSMARYLDVTSASNKSATITSDNQVLTTLVLLGGDANDDDRITIGDAAIIGGQYDRSGGAITDSRADINNDNKINIFDLVLMGGNYDKKSDTVYAGWMP